MIFHQKQTLKIENRLIDLSTPIVMGILNMTPDSFYDGGKYNQMAAALRLAKKHMAEGATLIDVGGYSSRPCAADIPVHTEIERVEEIIKRIKDKFPEAIISADTFRSEVARRAIEAGAQMINDVSGGMADSEIDHVVAHYGVAYVLMHTRGNPQNMMELTTYEHLITEIKDFFLQRIQKLHALGTTEILIDPGFGFAKNIDQNYLILRNLSYFKSLNLPILVGLSRKSMIYKTLQTTPGKSLNGSTVLHTLSLLQGASVLRVHDVAEAMECITLVKKYLDQNA